jgi:bla regulator protein blaR1
MIASVIENAVELADALWQATLALSIAAMVMLAIRRPLRRAFGAGTAYIAWLLLPAALLATLLPPPMVEVAAVAMTVPLPAAVTTTANTLAPPMDRSMFWLLLWALGAAITAFALWRQQSRFVASLGRLRALGANLWRAEGCVGLPAVIGVLMPRIVLPEDFDTRYDADERALMLAHERAHVRRRDPLANAGIAALRVLFWFNPLVHLAAARFRDDQELSCDQRVIAGCPQSRRAYGNAMLKTLVAAQPVPLGCHWGLAHPLKERLMQLKTQPPRPMQCIAGVVLAVALSAGVAFAVWSAQTARPVPVASASISAAKTVNAGDFRADIGIRLDDGEASLFAIEEAYGKAFSFVRNEEGSRFEVEATVREAGEGRYDIRAKIHQDGKLIAEPRLITESGKAAVVRIGEESADARFKGIELDITVTPPGRDRLPTPRARSGAVLRAMPEIAPSALIPLAADTDLGGLVAIEPIAPLLGASGPGQLEPLVPLPAEAMTPTIASIGVVTTQAVPLEPLPMLSAGQHAPMPALAPAAQPLPSHHERAPRAYRNQSSQYPAVAPLPPVPPLPPLPPEDPPAPPAMPAEPPAPPSPPTPPARVSKAASLMTLPSLRFLAPPEIAC